MAGQAGLGPLAAGAALGGVGCGGRGVLLRINLVDALLPSPFLTLVLVLCPCFWSFWLFSLFLLSDLGTQFRLISWIPLANSVPTDDISLASSSLSTSILASRIPAGARFFDLCAFL